MMACNQTECKRYSYCYRVLLYKEKMNKGESVMWMYHPSGVKDIDNCKFFISAKDYI